MSYENLSALQDEFLKLVLSTCIDKRLGVAENEKRLATLSTDRKVNGIHQDLFFVDKKSVRTNQLLRAVLDSEYMTIHLILINSSGRAHIKIDLA